jgi:hypothetical protein
VANMTATSCRRSGSSISTEQQRISLVRCETMGGVSAHGLRSIGQRLPSGDHFPRRLGPDQRRAG